jgi:hypothetical protein
VPQTVQVFRNKGRISNPLELVVRIQGINGLIGFDQSYPYLLSIVIDIPLSASLGYQSSLLFICSRLARV